ncbi:EAL domain-containing protein [Sinorhizobium meliloti]|nr:EAL domain-containing protein [Sinorhizobium meliloti]MDW9682521.1 EAL domain-containing protein [Sinorhizobium meliloti]MDW9692648.1 EAL domain-containing protein [Sinorhizobium meliloti]MDW9717573.1 EAL domain-containing protein [Sinorhizobium meliloti]MDW9754760.1 EAL domain-containing protein [Sinorhizobium meliloti]
MACTAAEGVETEEQSEILNRLGCDFQGFLLPKPMAKEMLRQFLGAETKRKPRLRSKRCRQ